MIRFLEALLILILYQNVFNCSNNNVPNFELVKNDAVQFDVKSKIKIFRLTESVNDLKKEKLLKNLSSFKSHSILTLVKLFDDNNEQLYELEIEDGSSRQKKDEEKHQNIIIFSRKSNEIQDVFAKNENWSLGMAFIQFLNMNSKNSFYNVSIIKDGSGLQRNLSINNVGHQASLLKALKYGSKLDQKVTYKLDGDLLEKIIAEEQYTLDAYSHQFLRVDIKTELKSTKCDKISKKCQTEPMEKCRRQIIEQYGIIQVSTSFDEFYAQKIGRKYNNIPNNFTGKKICFLNQHLKNLHAYGRKESVAALFNVMEQAKRANLNDMENCLNIKNNATNMHAMLSIFALTGRADFYFLAKNRLMLDTDQFLNWRLYVSVLPYAFHVNSSILEDLMNIVKNGADLDDIVTLSAASILNKFLSKNVKKEIFLDIFIEKFHSCTSDECFRIFLYSFQNLRHPKLVENVAKVMCTLDFKHDELAVTFLKKMSVKSWAVSIKINQKLMKLYKNRCPRPVDQTTRMLAANLLISSATPHTAMDVVSDILTAVELDAGKSAKEIRSYVLSLVEQFSSQHQYFKDVYKALRVQEKYNSFSQFLNNAFSQCSTKAVDFFGLFQPFYDLDVEFNRAILKRAAADIGMRMDDGLPSTIFGIELYSKAIMPVLDTFGSSSSDEKSNTIPTSNDFDYADDQNTEAGLLITMFDHTMAPIKFFDRQTALISAAWGADGSQLIAYNNSMMINEFHLTLATVSGHVIDFDLNAAMSLSIGGNVEISIWYKTLKAELMSKGSFGIFGGVTVRDENFAANFLREEHKIEILTEFGSRLNTDVDFYSTPVRFCLKINSLPTTVEMKILEKFDNDKKNDKIVKRSVEGACVNLPQLSKACSLMYG